MGTGGSIRAVICGGMEGYCGRLYLLGRIRPFQAERRLEWAPCWTVLSSGGGGSDVSEWEMVYQRQELDDVSERGRTAV